MSAIFRLCRILTELVTDEGFVFTEISADYELFPKLYPVKFCAHNQTVCDIDGMMMVFIEGINPLTGICYFTIHTPRGLTYAVFSEFYRNLNRLTADHNGYVELNGNFVEEHYVRINVFIPTGVQ